MDFGCAELACPCRLVDGAVVAQGLAWARVARHAA